jgi:hypothetical protein
MRIAICGSQHGNESPPASDRRLGEALRQLGCRVKFCPWWDQNEEWRSCEAVLIRSCWDYHLRQEEFCQWLARLESSSLRISNPLPAIRWNMDKAYLQELQLAGIRIPPTCWLKSGAIGDVGSICAGRGWAEAIVKPSVSASAWLTRRCARGAVSGPALVQEFVPEISTRGEWSLVYLGGRFSHAIHKLPAIGDFRVQESFGGTVQAAQPSLAMIDFADRVLTASPYQKPIARVDIVDSTNHGLLLMELELIEPELFLSNSLLAKSAAEAVLASLAAGTAI